MENVPLFPEWEDEYGQYYFNWHPLIEKTREATDTPPPPPEPIEPFADEWLWQYR